MDISNHDDVIDSRDVIDRIGELTDELTDAHSALIVHTTCQHCGQDIEGCDAEDSWRDRDNNTHCSSGAEHEPTGLDGESFEAWLARIADTNGHEFQDEAVELQILRALAAEAEGCGDWLHGETLIRDSYFVEYAQQLADDIGAVDRNASWPSNCIDWEEAAEQLKMDYTSVSFDGVDYWIRS